MPGSEHPGAKGAKGGKGGRPYTWEDGYALRHPGAFKAEPVDEDGLFNRQPLTKVVNELELVERDACSPAA